MKPLITFLLLCVLHSAFSQIQPYGQIDTASLKLTECPFEKNAGAMVLFDKGELKNFNYSNEIIRHKRIKILNNTGLSKANIKLTYISKAAYEDIDIVAAETINLTDGKIEYIPVDIKRTYKQKIDKYHKAVIITFPAVKAGSVIEFKYMWSTRNEYYYPTWYFQEDIPVAYSEFTADFRFGVFFMAKVKQEFIKAEIPNLKKRKADTKRIWALANVPSYKEEPYSPAEENISQQIVFFRENFSTWNSISRKIITDADFGMQLSVNLPGTDSLIEAVAKMRTLNDKIAAVFDLVKNKMTWDNTDDWFTRAGLRKAWDTRAGNSTEINLILYTLLKKARIEGFPVLVSTPDNGPIEPDYASIYQFNKTVVCVPADSTNYYILDATNKHGDYKIIPFDILNTYGLGININKKPVKEPDKNAGQLFLIRSTMPAIKVINTVSEITADGKMEGIVRIRDEGYNRETSLKLKELHNDKYSDYLKDGNNNLKISSVSFENADVDTLPLFQSINFTATLTQDDGGYIYLYSNLFSEFTTNPFISDTRNSNIEFGYLRTNMINSVYTLPEGLKIESLPQSISLTADDKSMNLRRFTAIENNKLYVRYTITTYHHYFTKEQYTGLKEFYKKMFEILNEPVVLRNN